MHLLRLLLALCCVNLVVAAEPAPATETTAEAPLTPEQERYLRLANAIKVQRGDILLPGRKARVRLPADQGYLSADDAATVLYQLWGNPEGPKPLGMIVPEGWSPFGDGEWAAVIQYVDEGHVKDKDAAKIDYDDLLKDMQEGIRDNNPERVKAGYQPMQLVGWATKPRYDVATHKLYWAKNLKFGDDPENTLNYNIRVLGRSGYLEINVIADMKDLATVEAATPKILASVDFEPGARYADFNEATDNVASYGVAALVAGGIASKAGFFKGLWLAIVALKKFIVVGVIALVAGIKKWVTGRKKGM